MLKPFSKFSYISSSILNKLQRFSTVDPIPSNKIISVKNKVKLEAQIVEVNKKNIKQSPMKIGFLVKLINRSWVPDALAQLKFSPKHRAVDISQLLRVIYKYNICSMICTNFILFNDMYTAGKCYGENTL